jgi:hypothetical protein
MKSFRNIRTVKCMLCMRMYVYIHTCPSSSTAWSNHCLLNMLQCAPTVAGTAAACQMDGAVMSSAWGVAQDLNPKTAWHVVTLYLRRDV